MTNRFDRGAGTSEGALAPDVIEEVISQSGGENCYVAQHDVREPDLSVTLSLALAAVTDSSPTDLIPRLSRHVDPDALDRMFRPLPNGDLRKGGPLYLDIEGHDVQIFSDGRIEIYQ